MSQLRLLPTLPLLLMPLLACPSAPMDDDDTPADDDDDDDDVDPCENPEDITAAVDARQTISGGTNNEDDDFTGSCNETTVGSNDALFVFTPAVTGRYLLSTEDPSTDFDTQLYAFTDCADPAGTELGCNDDIDTDGENFASELTIEVVEGEAVYIVIDGYEGVGHYEMSVTPLVCGDGLVAGGEMCDDGNTEPGDGCDADCRWECTDDAGEDDDTPETATEVTPPATVEGMLCPTEVDVEAGDFADFFVMNLTVGEYGSAEVQPTEGACADLNVGLRIVDAQRNVLSTDLTEEGGCPRVAVEAPVTGPYYVSVRGDDVTVPPQSYALTVDAGFSECGNGTVEGLEECDDGNLEIDDLCSDTCTVNDPTCDVVGTVAVGASVTGDTFGGGDDHVGSCFYEGGEGGEDVVYRYDAAADEIVVLSTNVAGSDVDTDTVVYVREQCRNPATEIACNDDSNEDNYLSDTGFRAEAGTSYWIFVDAWAQDGGVFELELSLATCGDGMVEPGEDCDDMNQTPGDGCENDCTATPLCAYSADQDLGVLAAGDHSATVDLTAGADTLPALTCSGEGGSDAMVRFEVENSGTLSIGATHTGGDVQYRLVADDGACTETVGCTDFGEEVVTGTLTAFVTPGAYFLAMEAFGAGFEATVEIDITAP